MKLPLSREQVENLLKYNDSSDSPANAEAWEVNALCRIALAGMDSEPAAFLDDAKLSRGVVEGEAGNYGGGLGAGYIPVFRHAAPPAPVASTAPDGLRMALSNAGIAAPESDEVLFATHEKYVQLLVDWVKDRKPFEAAPVAVPDEVSGPLEHTYKELTPTFMLNHISIFERYGIVGDGIHNDTAGIQEIKNCAGWYRRRAAMQAEPVTAATVQPHIYRELVNQLRDTAVMYQGCQQLREQLSATLRTVITPAAPEQK